MVAAVRKLIEARSAELGRALTDGECRDLLSDNEGAARMMANASSSLMVMEEVEVPCIDGADHDWVVSDENDNIVYCSRCGCPEY